MTTRDPAAAYRDLLVRLETERARSRKSAAHATKTEVQTACSGIEAGLHIAIGWAINLFEGPEAWQAYNASSAPEPAVEAGEWPAPAQPR